MERHLFPLSLMLVPYAAVTIDAMMERWPSRKTAILGGLAIASLPMLRDVGSIDLTLVLDARNQATSVLDSLPSGTHVEVYGGTQYMPHLPTKLSLVRVGPEAIDLRSPIPAVTEVVGKFADVDTRAPQVIVTSETFAKLYLPAGERRDARDEEMGKDPDGHGTFDMLVNERGAYEWWLRSRCDVPWPFECKRVHASTGAEIWVFRRKAG